MTRSNTKPRRAELAALLLATIGFAQCAYARDWIRADSDHFTVYSNLSESATRNDAEQLEAFKYLSELVLGADPASAVSSARFTVYLFDDRDLLRTVRPDLGEQIEGVYLHCAEGSLAFAHRSTQADIGGQDLGLTVLLHEYAHHVMYSRMRRFYPSWYVEGFAEYLSTATLRGNSYSLGASDEGRMLSLVEGKYSYMAPPVWIDFKLLLDPREYAAAVKKGGVDGAQFYAQAW